jgi:hypothetical protein
MVNNYKDYLPYLMEEYPDLSEKVLEKVIKEGLKNIQDLVHRDHDVRFWNQHKGREYHFGLVRGVTTDLERIERATRNFFRLRKLRLKRKEKKQ